MRFKRVLLVCGVCVLLSLSILTSKNTPIAQTVTVTGVVYADDWDDNDNVTAVVIETEDGEEYGISTDGKGKELLKLEDKRVELTGTVSEHGEGEKTITVTTYRILE